LWGLYHCLVKLHFVAVVPRFVVEVVVMEWLCFAFDSGVPLHWVGDLWDCWGYVICGAGGVCYLWSLQRLWLVGCGVMV
jgi:hypothetical protein